MSEKAGRPGPGQSALRAWLLIAGVMVGAIVAMSASWAFSWGVLAPTPEEKAQAAKEAREKAFTSPPGSCLTWTKVDASDVHKVPCTQQHLFEVVGVADISDKYGPKAKAPDAETWLSIAQERCGKLAEEYLGKPLDPYGKLTLGGLRPDPEQWAKGRRELHCGLQWTGPGGGLQKIIGKAVDQNQSDVWPPGTCLALENKSVGDPIPCAKQHSQEMVALVDLKKEFDEYPSEDEQDKWLDRRCNELAKQYAGGTKWKDQGLKLGWDIRKKVSWEAGSTQVNCYVGATLPDGSGLAPVQGSIRKGAQSGSKPKGEQEQQGQQGQQGGNQQPQPSNEIRGGGSTTQRRTGDGG